MKYIVQTNLIGQEDASRLQTALTNEGVSWYPVKVVPFVYDYVEGEPTPRFFDTIPTVVLGSGTLIRVAQNRGWGPGIWAGSNLRYDKYIEHYGEEMLNYHSVIYSFKDIPKYTGIRFIRPLNDGKAFAGEVIEGDRFEEWREHVIQYEVHTFWETPVLIAPVRRISTEWRFFVVDGKIVTGSRYYYNGRLYIESLVDRDDDIAAQQYAQTQVDRWQPERAFVIDIASTDDGLKIIELNSLNAAGFYASNIQAVIRAIEVMYA